jgi:hypothetical protein
MTLVQCIRKIASKRMWVRKGHVDYMGKTIQVALAFHRRDRFSIATPTQYYLSVGIGDPAGFDSTGQEQDPDVPTLAGAVGDTIRAECVAFDTIMTQNGHPDQLYIAYHAELQFNQTRLDPVYTYADQKGWLGAATFVARGFGKDGTTIVWPDLFTRKLKLYDTKER